jgi:DNA-directed RNA polymerase specialized sigma24 family protein
MVAPSRGMNTDGEQRACVLAEEAFRKEPILTQLAFTRLLEWLDDGVDSHGERYLEARRRLVSYFDRRNRPNPEDLTDETFDRIARTLEEDGEIATRPPARYCHVMARFVLLEDCRRSRRQVPLDESRAAAVSQSGSARVDFDERFAIGEQRLDCLDRLLEELKPQQRELALEYYSDVRRQRIERRRGLAARLGITMNALAIRASRSRDALMTRMEGCVCGVTSSRGCARRS